MRSDRIAEVSNDLDFTKHNLDGLIALFGYKSNHMIHSNKAVALSMVDCIINTMTELKMTIQNDDGKGDLYS